jgi:hypothetical protein
MVVLCRLQSPGLCIEMKPIYCYAEPAATREHLLFEMTKEVLLFAQDDNLILDCHKQRSSLSEEIECNH